MNSGSAVSAPRITLRMDLGKIQARYDPGLLYLVSQLDEQTSPRSMLIVDISN